MKLPPIRILDVSGSPEEMGHKHGSTYGEQIRHYAKERVGLASSALWSGGSLGRREVLDIAESMLASHEAFSLPLYTEMMAMAEAARITPAEAIIVGGFTDFIDTVRAEVGGQVPEQVQEDDCTAVIIPDHRAGGAGFLAQTWDMHDTATKHVVLLRLRPRDAPASLVFTTNGALAQLGMNEHGVCVGINNLTATDGRRGVTWPSVVREALNQTTAADARDVVLGADLAGGHNFHLFDAQGNGFSIEAMPSARPVETLGQDAIVRTNHTLSPESTALQGVKAATMMASSEKRLKTGRSLVDREGITTEDLMELTREAGSICQVPEDPYRVETSGAAIMRPRQGDFWACWGQPSMNTFTKIDLPNPPTHAQHLPSPLSSYGN